MIDRFIGKHAFLSNFAWCQVVFEGIAYPTSEHAFQAAKTLDDAKRVEICKAPTPGKAKRMGRKVDLRKHWEQVKVDVMRQILKVKFNNPFMSRKLLATEGQALVEGNNWGDREWGVCGGQGKNLLGKLLMEVRAELQNNTGGCNG